MLLASGDSAEEPGQLPTGGRAQMPADWDSLLGPDFRGRVQFTRGFGLPTGIEPEQRLDLVVDRVDAFGQVSLNGQLLGKVTHEPARFDVTALLKPRNELIIVVELPRLTPDSASLPRPGREHLPGGLIGEVRLEILDNDDFLRAYDTPLRS